jgi:hypothetical protein
MSCFLASITVKATAARANNKRSPVCERDAGVTLRSFMKVAHELVGRVTQIRAPCRNERGDGDGDGAVNDPENLALVGDGCY